MQRTTRPIMTMAAAAIAALSLAACGDSDEAGDPASQTTVTERSQTTTSSTTTQTASPTSTASATSTAAPAAPSSSGPSEAPADPSEPGTTPSDADAPAPTGGGDELTTRDSEALFVSPSGRISCHMTAMGTTQVRCDLVGATFPVADDVAADCEWDTGTSMHVSSDGGAQVGCVSDVVATGRADSEQARLWWQESFGTASNGQAVLPYGKSLNVGGARCTSTREHVRCTVDGQGFTISTGGYTLV
ncbi:hypothetical protein [Janibacter indicus]|uniref:hypothetical protein n=1 Tax=Janibacter indicus TaxID=857417 RepID=UPI003EBB1684